MGTFDIILIVGILLFIIIGISQGFLKMVIDFFTGLSGIIVAILLTKPVTWLLNLLHLDVLFGKLFSSPAKKIISEEAFNALLTDGQVTGEAIHNAIESPNFATKFIDNLFHIFKDSRVYTDYGNFIETVKNSYGTLIVMIIALIIVIIGIVILLRALRDFFTNDAGGREYSALNRTLGGIIGAGKALIIIFIIFSVLNIVSLIPFVGEFASNLFEGNVVATKINSVVSNILNDAIHKIDFSDLIK